MRKYSKYGTGSLGTLVLAALLSVPHGARARDEPALEEIKDVEFQEGLALDDDRAGSKISFAAGFDVVQEYWFRGIFQENQGFIGQPWLDLSANLAEDVGPLRSIDLNFGIWNSLHTGPSGDDDNQIAWYEADVYGGISLGLPYDLNLDVSYIVLASPNTGTTFADEVDLTLRYDDSALWKGWGMEDFSGLQPYAMLAMEVGNGSDAGDDKGRYLELGIEPSFPVIRAGNYPVTLSVPMALGLNLGNYYETAEGDDPTFGFFDVGLVGSVPLAFIPQDYGNWSASAGVHFIFLNDTSLTLNDDFRTYATVGVSMEF